MELRPNLAETARLGAMTTTVAILTIAECSGSLLYGMVDLFSSVRRDWSHLVKGQIVPSPFEVHLVGRELGPLRVANQMLVEVDRTYDFSADIVIVPEVLMLPETDLRGRFEPELAYLRHMRQRGATLATACTGAVLLAEAGLLKGHKATTHWLFCERLSQYPDVQVVPRQALVVSDGGRIVTAGGGTVYFDLCLYLIASTVGLEDAMHAARMALIDWHAEGQGQYAALPPNRLAQDGTIEKCQIWLAEHYDAPSPLADLLEQTGLSERSLQRRFRQATGLSPLEYLHAIRLEEAKQMLETSEAPIEAIAIEVGYEDASFFGRLFKRQVGMTPAQYRKRFAGLRQKLVDTTSQTASNSK